MESIQNKIVLSSMKKWKMIAIIWIDLIETGREEEILGTLKKVSVNHRGNHSESFEIHFNITVRELAPQGNST